MEEGPWGQGCCRGRGGLRASDPRTEQTQDTGVPTLPRPPGHLSRVGRRQGSGEKSIPWVYSGGFQTLPHAWRGPRGAEQRTQSPGGAPLAGSDITSMPTPRSRQLPAGLYGAGPAWPGPPPTPHDTHTLAHCSGVWGLGAPRAPQGCLFLHPLPRPWCSPAESMRESVAWPPPSPPSVQRDLLDGPQVQRGTAGSSGPLPTPAGPPQTSEKPEGTSLSRPLALVDTQPQTGGPEGRGESHHGDSRPTQLADAPASETSGASSGVGGLAGPLQPSPPSPGKCGEARDTGRAAPGPEPLCVTGPLNRGEADSARLGDPRRPGVWRPGLRNRPDFLQSRPPAATPPCRPAKGLDLKLLLH